MLLLNRKAQFSIIAALLVAAVLISAVVVTYSSIRYSTVDNQPQILSSIDETNLGLKEILGFTVGYYGSVLKVTGNMTYAQQLAQNYLKSGLGNMGDVQPEWGAVFNLQSLSLTQAGSPLTVTAKAASSSTTTSLALDLWCKLQRFSPLKRADNQFFLLKSGGTSYPT